MSEKVLPYDKSVVPQEQPWDCGPASCQVVLNSRGIIRTETDLIGQIGTTVNGTDYVGLIERVLDLIVPDARYTSVNLPDDPATADQKDQLWRKVVESIDGGFGIVMNWVAPPNNYPVGVKGSASPSYGGGTIYHYVACMGYDDNPTARAVWIADSGFRPFGYWISFDQVASLIPPKAYAYADTEAEPSAPTAPDDQGADTLLRAMGGSVSFGRYCTLLPAVSQALEACQCNTVDRVAMWMAQVGEESGGLQWMEEIADGSEYEGRADLGNTQPGDGPRFKGRGPIQVTGRHNYTELSTWAFGSGLVPTATFFVDQPDQLGSDRYGFTGVVRYWTVARNMNSYADAADIVGATVAVNGGTHGIDDRTNRWNRCRAMGPALLTIETGVTTMADAQEIENATAGVDVNGSPLDWRWAFSREPRDFNQVVKDPSRGPWTRRMPDGTVRSGHTDAYEQIVPINEQIAWTHVFSDGIERDSGDVLLELMEFAIQWRESNDLPSSAFTAARQAGTGSQKPATRAPKKQSAKAVKKP